MACENCNCGKKQMEENAAAKLVEAKTVDKIEIKQRYPDKLMTGMNTIVLMNGQPIRHAKSVELKIDGRGMGIVKIEMYAEVKMDEAIVADAEVKCGSEE